MKYFILLDAHRRWWYTRATSATAAAAYAAWRLGTAILCSAKATVGIPEFCRYLDPSGEPTLEDLLDAGLQLAKERHGIPAAGNEKACPLATPVLR